MNNSLIQQFFQVPIYIRFLGSEETAVKKKKLYLIEICGMIEG